MSVGTTGRTLIAGVIGRPVAHSLSPLIHSAWIAAASLDAVYVPLSPPEGGLGGLMLALKGSGVLGFNVTIPFKEDALVVSTRADAMAKAAGAANLLLFDEDGDIEARNTDGEGLLYAFRRQAPDFSPKAGPVVILGAGGAARGAAAVLLKSGAPEVRIVNRTLSRAEDLADVFGRGVSAYPLAGARKAFDGAAAVINATSAGLDGAEGFSIPLEALPDQAVAMDMVYKPLETPFLAAAKARGLKTVDGLDMLVGQAIPSFEALFGRPPPPEVDARALALEALTP